MSQEINYCLSFDVCDLIIIRRIIWMFVFLGFMLVENLIWSNFN